MSTVLLIIHCPTVPIVSERRLPSDVTLSAICERVELLSGIPPESQRFSLWNARTDDLDSRATLEKDLGDVHTSQRTLEEMGAVDGMGLKVIDVRSSAERDRFGQEEEDGVEKYEMDDEAYAKRQDSVLAYKQRNKIGRFGETSIPDDVSSSVSLPTALQPGARCEVEGGRRGTVRFVGNTHFAAGQWVGVEYDEPVGKNDGSVKGERYFDCKQNFGGFVKSDKVKLGNYPERGLEDDDDDEDEEM